MELVQVRDRKTRKLFLDVPRALYKDDSVWVCPLDNEIEAIFDPSRNKFFEKGDAIRWVLTDNGRSIGRVAAFYNENKALRYQIPTGGIGFFECINDREAAFTLFDRCRDWLAERGMEAMDGPVNFGENDNFWGLLVEGYTHPSHGMNYNFPYYKDLFEAYGFYGYFEQITNHLDLTKPFPERFWKIANWILKKNDFTFEHLTYEDLDRYFRDFKEIYDKAWQFHEHFVPLDLELIAEEFGKAKPIAEEDMIWFAYHQGKPIAFVLMYPDVNQILKHLNGKLHLWNKLRFLYLKKRKTMTRTRITMMGVIPEYQRHGVESGLFRKLDEVMAHKPHYTEIELSWVGDFNPKMRALHESVGADFAKKHVTYRKIFDEGKVVEQKDIISRKT